MYTISSSLQARRAATEAELDLVAARMEARRTAAAGAAEADLLEKDAKLRGLYDALAADLKRQQEDRDQVSVSVLCGSPVWSSTPVVGLLWDLLLCVGPLCGSPVWVPRPVAPRSMWHLLAWCLSLVHTLPHTRG